MIASLRLELRLLLRGFVLPVCVIVCALFAVANVANQAGAVHSDYALVQHTRAEYRANGLDFEAALAQPAKVVTRGDEQTVTNLARYDYDTMASAIIALSPASSIDEVLKYFGFVFFPALFFLLGLWMSTAQRRYRLEKVTLVRAGTVATVAARQLSLLVSAVVIVAAVVLVDAVSRAVATSVVSTQLPFHSYPPISSPAPSGPFVECGLVLLVVAFFGGVGILVGALVGVFAVPAIAFVIWDLVVPFLGPGDPRDWFVVLGHSAFGVGSGFQLAPAIPLPEPTALVASIGGALLFLAVAYPGIRVRNPLAT